MDKNTYLDKYIFAGLTNLNDGFDAGSIKYFSQNDFEIVIDRVEANGLGIYGIESWKSGEYFGVEIYDEDSEMGEWWEACSPGRKGGMMADSLHNALVVGGGFEPPKAEPSDLQSDPFDHSGTPPKHFFFLEPTPQIERRTFSLQVRSSTN